MALEIVFPRVTGYRVDLPEERLTANFTEDSKFVLTPEMVGPGQTLMEGIVGEGVLFAASYQALPLLICGMLKIVSDLLLLVQFRGLKPPEES